MKVCLGCRHNFQAAGWACPACGCSPAERGRYPAFAPDETEAVDSYDAACFSRLAALEAGSFWFEGRNRLLVWALRRYFPSARSFLEIGCGTGFVLAGIQRAFPALTLAGAEVFSEGLAHASERAPGATLSRWTPVGCPSRRSSTSSAPLTCSSTSNRTARSSPRCSARCTRGAASCSPFPSIRSCGDAPTSTPGTSAATRAQG